MDNTVDDVPKRLRDQNVIFFICFSFLFASHARATPTRAR